MSIPSNSEHLPLASQSLPQSLPEAVLLNNENGNGTEQLASSSSSLSSSSPSSQPREVIQLRVAAQQNAVPPQNATTIFQEAIRIAGVFMHKFTLAISLCACVFTTQGVPTAGRLVDVITASTRHVDDLKRSVEGCAQTVINVKNSTMHCVGYVFQRAYELATCFV